MGYLGATLTQVFTCAQSGRVTQRFHNSPRRETGLQSVGDVTHRKRAEDFGNLKKVSRVETRHRTRRLTFACSRRPWAGVARDGGSKWKSQHRKIVPLSPYVDTFNSKVIKGFVPELRSRYVFFEFRDSYVLRYIYMNIRCTFSIFISWLWYTVSVSSLSEIVV